MMCCSGAHILLKTSRGSLVHSAETKTHPFVSGLLPSLSFPGQIISPTCNKDGKHFCFPNPHNLQRVSCHVSSKSAKPFGAETSAMITVLREKCVNVKTQKDNLSRFAMFWTSKQQFSVHLELDNYRLASKARRPHYYVQQYTLKLEQ